MRIDDKQKLKESNDRQYVYNHLKVYHIIIEKYTTIQ